MENLKKPSFEIAWPYQTKQSYRKSSVLPVLTDKISIGPTRVQILSVLVSDKQKMRFRSDKKSQKAGPCHLFIFVISLPITRLVPDIILKSSSYFPKYQLRPRMSSSLIMKGSDFQKNRKWQLDVFKEMSCFHAKR